MVREIWRGMAASTRPSLSIRLPPVAIGKIVRAKRLHLWAIRRKLRRRGLSDDEVCIRDRYRIGAGLFEVTQPRVTWYRVGVRMNEPRMAALLVLCRWSDRRRLEATYRQLAGDVVPALLDMLRCSMFGGYPAAFLSSASAVRVYLKGAMGQG